MQFPRIRSLREDHDLPQRALASYLQIHQTTYSDYELGRLKIPPEILIQLATYYHTSVDYLLGLTDETSPYPQIK